MARHRRDEREPDLIDLGLDDPALHARWARESELIRIQLADERFLHRRRATWILLIGFLIAVISLAIWTILTTSRW
jgi:hypothetical protein